MTIREHPLGSVDMKNAQDELDYTSYLQVEHANLAKYALSYQKALRVQEIAIGALVIGILWMVTK